MRVLVTGIGGFVGPVLARALLARGHEVHGLLRAPAGPRLSAVTVRVVVVDLADAPAVATAVQDVEPDAVVHLAGLTFAPAAEADPPAAYRANVLGLLNLLGALRAHAPRARLVVVSSSEAYGRVERGEIPIDEDTPLRPQNVYGASKAAAELTAGQWARSHGLDVVVARPFNHTGPGQDAAFVCAGLARQVASIEAGRQEPVLRVGNLDPVRDFSDVRDVAAGYVALLERGRAGRTYNLCRGEGVSIAEVVAILRTHATVPLRVYIDPARRRANDVSRIIGSPVRAASDTGWAATIPLDATLRDVLVDWRARLGP